MEGLAGTTLGIPPVSLAYASNGIPYTYRVDGNGQISMFMLRMTANLEIQLFHTDTLGFIVFGGSNFAATNMTITTPYSLIVPSGYTNAGQAFSGYSNVLTIASSMSGGQFGIQMDINSNELGIRLSPFIMMTSFSGTATLTDNPGDNRASSTTISTSIPSTTSTAIGFDIIYKNISVGSVLQQLTAQQQGTNNVNIFMIPVGYRFSNEGEQLSIKEQKNSP